VLGTVVSARTACDLHRRRMTKTARVYKIEMLIRNRGHVSFRELLNELEVSPATLKRDLDYLKDRLGAPIEYDRFLNGYRFGQEYRGHKHELPGLWFSERELYSLLMANQLLSELDAEGVISRHLRPLLERIHQMLGTSDAEAKALLKRVKILSVGRRPVHSKWFELLGDALLKRRRVYMRYQTRGRRTSTQRDVSPQRLVHYRSTWYLDAWCHERERLLRFALDAVEHAEILDSKAKEVTLETVEAELDGGYGIFGGSKVQWATLVFSPAVSQWVSREEWHPAQKTRWLDDGLYEMRVPFVIETELLMDVLRHAGQVTVKSPVTLVRALDQQLRAALAAHAPALAA
jgi:predicted DNA-binding transcriptional regulator YafY